jgi:hypothetical protein
MAPIVAAALIGAATKIGTDIAASNAESSAKESARNYLASQKAQTDSDYAGLIGQIQKYYTDRGSLGSAKDATDYKAAIYGYDPSQFTLDLNDPKNQFTYDKTREDFLNPYYDMIIQDTADKIQHSAAGAGLGRNPGTASNIAREVALKENELFKEAQQEYNQDRQFAYNKYSDYIRNMQDNLSRKMSATNTKLSMQGNLAQDYYNTMDARQSDLLKAEQDRINAGISYATAMQGLY